MPKPTKTSEQELPPLTPLELNRIVRLAEAGRLCGLSETAFGGITPTKSSGLALAPSACASDTLCT